MSEALSGTTNIESRLAGVERSLRRWRFAFIGLAGAVVVAFASAADTPKAIEANKLLKGDGAFESIAAKRLVLFGDDGEAYFSVMKTKNGGGVLSLRSAPVGGTDVKTIMVGGTPGIAGVDEHGMTWRIDP